MRTFIELGDNHYLANPPYDHCTGDGGVTLTPVASIVEDDGQGNAPEHPAFHIVVENKAYVLLKPIEAPDGKVYYGKVADWPSVAIKVVKDHLPVVPGGDTVTDFGSEITGEESKEQSGLEPPAVPADTEVKDEEPRDDYGNAGETGAGLAAEKEDDQTDPESSEEEPTEENTNPNA